MPGLSRRQRIVLVITAALLIPILPFIAIGELPGERWLSANDDNALRFGLLGAGLLASDFLLPIPSSIVGTLLGTRLGFLPGLAWAWSGLILGNLVAYGAGRLLPNRFTDRLPTTPTLLAVFASRPVPVLAEAAALTAGAERVPALAFALTAAAGNLVYALVLAGTGAALLPESILGPGLLIPMLLPAAAWLIWRWLAWRARAPAAPETSPEAQVTGQK